MFERRINFGVMLCPQYFYNKSYAKKLLLVDKNNISIEPKLESVTVYHIRLVVILL